MADCESVHTVLSLASFNTLHTSSEAHRFEQNVEEEPTSRDASLGAAQHVSFMPYAVNPDGRYHLNMWFK